MSPEALQSIVVLLIGFAVAGLLDGEIGLAGQDLSHVAAVMGGQVLDHEDGGKKVGRERSQHHAEGVDPARGCRHGDHAKRLAGWERFFFTR